MFSVGERDRVRDRVLQIASSDPRVVSAAVVGALAGGDRDRWSDVRAAAAKVEAQLRELSSE